MSNNIEAPKGPKDLFIKNNQSYQAESLTDELALRTFPLGAFSEFIVNEQPHLLSAVRDKSISAELVGHRQRNLLTSLRSEDLTRVMENPELARVAMLDLSFAMSAVIFSGATPPTEVQQLNQQLAQITGLPEMMTFEKIISINSKLPFSHMRTFSEGELRDSEKHFYYGHDLMNTLLQDTIDSTTQSVNVLHAQGERGVTEVKELLAKGVITTQRFADFMRNYHKMPTAHFGTFRQYFAAYPDGETRNASGAFIGMPRLQIRLTGLTPKYEEFLEAGMRYFPVDEQSDIQQAQAMAKDGNYLVAQCEGLPFGESQLILATGLKSLIEPIRDFRLSHLAAVYKYIPAAVPEGIKDLRNQLSVTEEEPIFDDSSTVVKGSGGFLSGPLLRNILRMDLKAIKRLNTIIETRPTK